MLVVLLEYGKDFSGPGKDVFHGSRATGEPDEAHASNFLHPVLYYYEQLPTGKSDTVGMVDENVHILKWV